MLGKHSLRERSRTSSDADVKTASAHENSPHTVSSVASTPRDVSLD